MLIPHRARRAAPCARSASGARPLAPIGAAMLAACLLGQAAAASSAPMAQPAAGAPTGPSSELTFSADPSPIAWPQGWGPTRSLTPDLTPAPDDAALEMTEIPLPGALVLLGASLAALGLAARRRSS